LYRTLPKEEQTAFQRWEIASFEEVLPRNEARRAVLPVDRDLGTPPGKEEPSAEATGIEPTVTQATVEDVHALIEDMKREAQEAGYRAGLEKGLVKGKEEGYARGQEDGHRQGLEKGFEKGLEEGRAKGEREGFEKGYREGTVKGEEYAGTLKALSESFAADVAQANETIADDLLTLGLDFAKAMLKTAFAVKPELIVPVVADAVRYLPSLQQPVVLRLNPEDAAIIRKAMGEELEAGGWRIAEEPLERGSCRIETAANQLDGSLATRWKRLAESMGKISDWMA
jgi:flagellar assembly protein FliH